MSRSYVPAGLDERLVSDCLALVAPAADAFLSRWRLSTLRRLDPELHGLLIEQENLYNAALVTGTADEAREQSAAMVRGWRAAVARCEATVDDAYLVGACPRTGTRVCVGTHLGSVARVQADPNHAGLNVLFVTPDEVARMMGGLALVASCKTAFPDAEVIELYPQETPHPQEAA